METRHIPGQLYYHRTDGGAEYLCAGKVPGTEDEGDLSYAVVRLDGIPELLGVYPAAPDLVAALRGLVEEFDRYDAAMTKIGRGHSDLTMCRAEARAVLAGLEGKP